MSIVNQIFQNELIKKAAFSSLRKIMKEHKLKGILVKRKNDDDFDFEFLNEDQIIISLSEFSEMRRVYIEYISQPQQPNENELPKI